jgi:hypothetical protein
MKDSLTKAADFSHLLLGGDFAQSLCSSPMITLKVRQRSSEKLTQFPMLNKVQDPRAFNISACLTRAAVLLKFT